MDRSEIIKILQTSGTEEELFSKANAVRRKQCGNFVHLRGLIEFSNFCKKNCLYCGINCKNKTQSRFRLSQDEIISTAKFGKELGLKTIVLQSGEDDYFTPGKMCRVIEKIKDLGVALTLSLGEKTKKEYAAYKKAGADRYLLRIETTDNELYKKMHPDADIKSRIKCLYNLKELGFEVGTGILIGLSGQSMESIADDILFFKKLNADMIGLGPLIPHPDTELKDSLPGDFILTLKVMAIVRLLMPNINIPATTAMETLCPNGRKKALTSGANVVMPNITPQISRQKYSIYPDKAGVDALDKDSLKKLYDEIASIGDRVSEDFGTSKNFKN